MGAEDSEREQLVKAHAWIRLFADGRTLNNYNEEGVWFDRLPQKRVDGSIFITTGIQPWADVEVDLRARGVLAPDLTRGELAAKRALGLVVALLVLMAGCATPQRNTNPLWVDPSDKRTITVTQVPEKERIKIARELAGLDVEGPSPIRVTEDGCIICCPDMRWGKCDEHGEWWSLYGFRWAVDQNEFLTVLSLQKPLRQFLICPGPPVHYIERPIKGPKEKP